MTEPFVAEIRIFAGNFAPKGWAQCNGQLMPISQNTALFSLLGTQFGGDGKSTFALPNMQGRAPMHHGQGSGLSLRDIGETAGEATLTLLESEIPAHSHSLMGIATNGEDPNPGPDRAMGRSVGAMAYQNVTNSNLVQLDPQTLSIVGGSLPHNNMQPFLTLLFIIALQGVYPARQ